MFKINDIHKFCMDPCDPKLLLLPCAANIKTSLMEEAVKYFLSDLNI